MATHTGPDPCKVWRELSIRAKHEVVDVLRNHAMGAAMQVATTQSTNPDVLAVYRAKVDAFETAIAVLEAANEEE